MKNFNVVIVGGGIAGCAIAEALSRRKFNVAIIEPGRFGGEASGAAAGMLTPFSEVSNPGPLLETALQALGYHAELAKRLRAATGIDVGFKTLETLQIATSPQEALMLQSRLTWRAPAGVALTTRWLESAEVLRLEPSVGANEGALLVSGQARVNAARLTDALARAAMRQGVRHIKGKVISMSREGKEIISLSLDVGTKVSAHTYIFAMGAWSRIGLPEWIGQDVPVTPVRGQVLTLKGLTSPHRALVHGSNYLLPHWGRGCLGGTTEERVGFRDQVTHAGEKSILKKIKTMTNGHWTVLAGRSGLRPVSNDGLPIIGPIPGLNRAYLATGYGRKGILLGPLLGERLAEDIEKGTRSVPLDFRPGRG